MKPEIIFGKGARAFCGVLVIAMGLFATPALAQADGQFYVHTAKSGDTLIHLAQRFLLRPGNWQSLQKLNRITDPHRIRPGTQIRIPLADMKTEQALANVVSVAGPVDTNRGKLSVGSALGEGQEITTGDNGFVTLKLADGSTMLVQSKSRVKLELARTIANTGGIPVTRANLESGRIEAKVERRAGPAARFEVTTPSSNMGVRGTQFRVSADEGGKVSRGEVLEGSVAVSGSGSAQLVGAGFGTVIAQGAAPSAPVKLLPAPDLSSAPALQERILLRFKLADMPGASAFRAQVASDRAFADLRAEGVFKTAEAKFGSLADGAYFLRVRAIDAQGIEGADTVLPFKLKARPEPPFTSLPQNKAKFSGETADFRWAAASEAASYRVQLARDPAFAQMVVDDPAVRNVDFRPSGKLLPGEYFWRVASTRADGDKGPFGDVQSFTLKPVPAAPNPPKEEGGKIGFSWGGEPLQRFDFQLARDAGFKEIVQEQRLDRPQIAIDKPSAAGTYFMRYRAIDPDGFIAPYSSAQSFEVERNYWWMLLLLLVPLAF